MWGEVLNEVPFPEMNANSGASGRNEVGAFAGRGVKRGLPGFPQVTLKDRG